MTHARPLRIRLLAILGAMGLGLALIPAGAALAVVPTAGNISGTISGNDLPAGIPATLVWTETTTLVTTSHPTTDEGWFSADLPFGTYTVTISNPHYAEAARGPITISEASPYSSLDVTLTRTWGNISGTISGNDLPAGIPATLVWTETTTLETTSHPTTDEGYFSADLPFGTYAVTISNPHYGEEIRGPITINAAAPYFNPLDVTLTRTWGNISGTVTGNDLPAGIPATLVWTETTSLETTSHPTNDEGYFSADLPFGTYTVTFSNPHYADEVRGPITINAAAPYVNPLNVTLTRTWGNISGTVTAFETGTGYGATMLWTETTTGTTYTGPTLGSGWFSADLPFGTYTVTFSSFGYDDAVRGPITITAAAPSFNPLDVAIVRAWGNISGTITGADIVAGIPATLVWTETTTLATTSHPTLADGWFSSDRAFGTYLVTISSPGYADAVHGPITITTASPYDSLDVALVRSALPALPAAPVPTSGLESDTKDTFDGCAALTPGAQCELELPGGLSGHYVSVFGHSTPVAFGGWLLVDADGKVAITTPACFPAGAHKLVVQDANSDVIGWKDVTVAAAVGGCAPTGTGSGTPTGGSPTGASTTNADTATPTPTPTPTVEPTPQDAEEPDEADEPVEQVGPEAQAESVDAFPTGWLLGGVGAAILLALIVTALVWRARRS